MNRVDLLFYHDGLKACVTIPALIQFFSVLIYNSMYIFHSFCCKILLKNILVVENEARKISIFLI